MKLNSFFLYKINDLSYKLTDYVSKIIILKIFFLSETK